MDVDECFEGSISRYMTITLAYLAQELGYVDRSGTPHYLDLCDLFEKTKATQFTTPHAQRLIDQAELAYARRQPLDNAALGEVVWNCRANAPACEAAAGLYKVVDIKGQV